ncbi:hypothetical protein TWF694_007747 [Orbilia ellipsospora]|uniref:C2 domain-containing protein n=1 Tax=Orbilia ellipsospora TaxID=2528407 RepID=A0AAV9XIM8_9PEZI
MDATTQQNPSDVTPQTSSANNSTNEKLPDSAPYDLFLTIESATHVPVGDISGTSDVYAIGKLKNVKGLVNPKSSRVHFRTSTKRATRDPEWNEKWRFGGVREGTYLKLKLYDEDGKQEKDDKLGSIKLVFRDFKTWLLDGQEHTRHIPIRRHKGNQHVQFLTAIFDLCNPEAKRHSPEPQITIKLQLLPPKDSSLTHIQLQNPTRYSIHYSPLANLVATTPSRKHNKTSATTTTPTDGEQPPPTSFKAYKFALIHPPPYSSLQFNADIAHAKAFDPSKLHYRILRHLVRNQYQNIYGHDKNTVYNSWWDADEAGPGLVDLLQPVENKIFTFVITTSGEWRFCETGDEFKINHISKHGMHANGKDKVVWAGEFFVRFDNEVSEEDVKDAEMYDERGNQEETAERKGRWKIYLDNDSGTYSPDKEKLGDFREFMAKNLRGIEIVVKDFQDEKLKEAKEEQKGKNKEDGEKNGQEEKKSKGPRRIVDILTEENERRVKEEEERLRSEKRARSGSNSSDRSDVNLF